MDRTTSDRMPRRAADPDAADDIARGHRDWNSDLAQELAAGLAQEIGLLRTLCERLQEALLHGLLPRASGLTAPVDGDRAPLPPCRCATKPAALPPSTASTDAPDSSTRFGATAISCCCTGPGNCRHLTDWSADGDILAGLQAIDRITQGLDDLGRVARQLARTPPDGPDGLARAIRLRDLRDRLFPDRRPDRMPLTRPDAPGDVQLF